MRAAAAGSKGLVSKGGGKSEDLSKTVKFDEMENEEGGDYGGYDEDDDGEEKRYLQEERDKKAKQTSSLWDDPEFKKDKGKVLQTLIQQFSMIVQKEELVDENGDPTLEVEYTKLPSALRAIKKIHR